MKRVLVLLCVALFAVAAIADELPRRGMAGVAVGPNEQGGVAVREVFPGSASEKAGLKPGDVIASVDGKAVSSPLEFAQALLPKRANQTATFALTRNGEQQTVTLTMMPAPLESSPDYEVVYGIARADARRLRTMITRPKGAGPFPAVYIIPGLGCFSLDNARNPGSYRPLIDALTKRGFVTVRVDKPGMGDSEGGPCTSADFNTEVKAFRAGLAAVKELPYVDKANVTIFGHSMGGFMAPLVSDVMPVKRAVVYGTGYNSWLAYMLENGRRQMRLRGVSYEEIADAEKKQELFAALFYVQKWPLEKILKEYPQFREEYPDGRTLTAGKEGKFFQQLYDVNLAKAWKAFPGEVVAVWGTSDFVSNETDHRWLADAVNSWKPGKGTFIALENTDHWLTKAGSFAESIERGPGPEYNDKFTDILAGA